MSKVKGLTQKKNKSTRSVDSEVPAALGRKRDPALDTQIVEAALDVLAKAGFDSMTMDMVAAKAKAGKAALYRRWSSKAELVRDALIQMSQGSVDTEVLPDTGSLRGDLLAVVKEHTSKHTTRKLQVLAKLGSFFTAHQKLSEEAMAGIFDPWNEVNRELMNRAAKRGEISKNGDIAMACEVIVAMTSHYTRIQNRIFDKTVYAALIDGLILPALKNPGNRS